MMSKWAKEFEKSGAVSIGVDPGASDETLVYIFFEKYDFYNSMFIFEFQNFRISKFENNI